MLFGSWQSTTDSTRHEPNPSGDFLPNNPGKGVFIFVNRRRTATPSGGRGSGLRNREKAFATAAWKRTPAAISECHRIDCGQGTRQSGRRGWG